MHLEEPIKQILVDTRPLWDHPGTRPAVRESFRRMIDCRTPALGWQVYSSESEEKRVYHTCKAKPCPSCGYRATLLWQREQCTELPYASVVFNMRFAFDTLSKSSRFNTSRIHLFPYEASSTHRTETLYGLDQERALWAGSCYCL